MVRVTRGRTYQFTVMAGETHPFYITDTIIGGGAQPEEESMALRMFCGLFVACVALRVPQQPPAALRACRCCLQPRIQDAQCLATVNIVLTGVVLTGQVCC